MTRSVHDALASHPVETTVHRRLHDVRPHEVFEVTYDGQRVVCKVAQHPLGDPELEARILQFVAAETPVPVPPIMAVGSDHFVAGWCRDLPADPTVDETRSRAMGAGLARLHESASERFDAPGHLEAENGSLALDADDRWSDTLVAFLDERRRFLEPRGYGDVATEVLGLVEAFPEAFDDVGDPTLLHGNALPDHVGIDRSADPARVTRVIDFEHALVGPPAFDLLRSIGPTYGPPGATHDPDGRAAFLEGYATVRPLPADLEETFRPLGVVNGVAYLRALHLQRGDRDAPQSVARRARGLAEHVLEAASEVRSALRSE
ncbi:aminoglycoside phosphotransferase [Salinarchaeum sp. Harcht-Bsk1]|uniref:phosphotransferase family protein n=1 Tax=Salinarchaeum sp. Harcht-Bsk1 TaxID=1333523 RepID=UPI0003423F95|nr:aminoglycoside phosphotransferase family protein [Salinarchaeum sp. Harcht-Bsk1]AGN00540.1 aminoglycoside phosphotransferase [Salinarchaeum sp. Harcht-Bsk1]